MQNTAYPTKTAAVRLGVSERLVWTLIKAGELGCIRIGGRTLVTERQINKFLRRKEAAQRPSVDSTDLARDGSRSQPASSPASQ